jgi:hypothetical protein
MPVLTSTKGFDIDCDDEKYENKKIKAVVKVKEVPFFKSVDSLGNFSLEDLKKLVVPKENSNHDGKQINYIIVLHYCCCTTYFSIIILL